MLDALLLAQDLRVALGELFAQRDVLAVDRQLLLLLLDPRLLFLLRNALLLQLLLLLRALLLDLAFLLLLLLDLALALLLRLLAAASGLSFFLLSFSFSSSFLSGFLRLAACAGGWAGTAWASARCRADRTNREPRREIRTSLRSCIVIFGCSWLRLVAPLTNNSPERRLNGSGQNPEAPTDSSDKRLQWGKPANGGGT